MQKYVLDTNIFFNMEAGIDLGVTTKEVMKNLEAYAKQLSGELAFYMPPRIIEELLTFFDNKEEPFVKEFLSVVTVQSPHIGDSTLSATVFYNLIDDIRKRSYRGLNIAEEEITNTAQNFMGKEHLDKKSFQISVGEHIKKFRDRYRNATRAGFLDSVADLDIIVLARELNATLVSTDEGVISWARQFGVQEVLPGVWKHQLESLVSQKSHHQE